MTAEEKIWNYLKEQGLSDAGAAGLMGNLYAESGLRPDNLQNSYESKLGMADAEYTELVDKGAYTNFVRDSAGYGLAQWTFWSRKEALLAYAKAAGKSIGDLDMQLGFLMQELSTGYKAALSILKTATTVRAASDVVLVQFERAADQSEAAKSKRASYGQTYYDKYAGKTSSPQTGGNGMTKLYASAVITVAAAEIGYKEKASNSQLDDKTANAGSNNWTKYAEFFDKECPNWYNGKKNGYAWCDMFVDYCFHKAYGHENALMLLCQPEKSAGAGCTYSYAYYKKKGQVGNTPRVGAQIFFGYSESNLEHTGIVEKFDAIYVYTVEGNTSNMVANRMYSKTDPYIFGYGYPDYDAEDGGSSGSVAAPATPSTSASAPASGMKVGDVVEFVGTKHYTDTNALAGYTCKPGKAKVTQIYQSGKHPVHLVAEAGGGSNVYGWVDSADIRSGTTIAVGSKVRVNNGAKTYTGGNLASYVYSTVYEVIQVSGDRVVIGQNGVVTAAVNAKDLTLA